MKNLATNGNKRASLVLRLADDYDRTLSTILVGNNIVNIASASLATVFFVGLLGGQGVTVSTIVTTIIVLIFGEITPKSLAKESPEKFALVAAPLLYGLAILLTPVNYFFSVWKKLISLVFKTSNSANITEEELLILVDEAEKEGSIESDDAELIENSFHFNDSRVVDILTPRVDIEALAIDFTLDQVAKAFIETGYTRMPVYKESLDDIVGVVHLHDLFAAYHTKEYALENIMMPVEFIAPGININQLLRILQQKKTHMAVVVDEYGGTLGIVTMEDILEELVGEIWDEHDEIQEEIRMLADGRYLILGDTDIQDVFDLFNIKSNTQCLTLNGWITEILGRFPHQNEIIKYDDIEIQIAKLDGKRVRESIIQKTYEGYN